VMNRFELFLLFKYGKFMADLQDADCAKCKWAKTLFFRDLIDQNNYPEKDTHREQPNFSSSRLTALVGALGLTIGNLLICAVFRPM
jgi:hypothetical protein